MFDASSPNTYRTTTLARRSPDQFWNVISVFYFFLSFFHLSNPSYPARSLSAINRVHGPRGHEQFVPVTRTILIRIILSSFLLCVGCSIKTTVRYSLWRLSVNDFIFKSNFSLVGFLLDRGPVCVRRLTTTQTLKCVWPFGKIKMFFFSSCTPNGFIFSNNSRSTWKIIKNLNLANVSGQCKSCEGTKTSAVAPG